MTENKIKGVLTSVIAVLIGLTFIIAMTGILNPQTEISSAVNESQDISSARLNGNEINDSVEFTVDYDYETTGNSPIKNFVINNGTDEATETTDYVVNLTEGSYTLENSSYWQSSDNDTLVSYDYYDEGYLENSFARTLTGLILGFAALVLLAWLVSWLIRMFGTPKY